jgi:hypothetical protein
MMRVPALALAIALPGIIPAGAETPMSNIADGCESALNTLLQDLANLTCDSVRFGDARPTTLLASRTSEAFVRQSLMRLNRRIAFCLRGDLEAEERLPPGRSRAA